MRLPIGQILDRFPIRLSVTDYCNLDCFFCHNEGMGKGERNTTHIDVNRVNYLLRFLRRRGLSNISITGGEPTLHPEIDRIVGEVKRLGFQKSFFHSNGVGIDEDLLKSGLYAFTKIGVSLHATRFENWSMMTRGTEKQWARLNHNIRLLGESGEGRKVEIKSVPVRGYNFDDESVKGILDLCDRYSFRFKFLQFEPVTKEHGLQAAASREIVERLKSVGCVEDGEQNIFRGQSDYLPAIPLRYGSSSGVYVNIGCGKEMVCRACYKSNETFIDPRLEIKPCHVNGHFIPLADLIDRQDEQGILNAIVAARDFLQTAPGQNTRHWRENEQ